MKNTITIIAFFLLVHISCTAQNFVSENKLWSVLSRDASGENMWERTIFFKFIGDTTLNDTKYLKLFESSDNGENWKMSSLWYEKNDSVFQYSPSDKIDVLTYNFSLQEKDSFYFQPVGYLDVDSVSTQIWGNSERKIIYLSSNRYSYSQTKWIQGVGQDGYITQSSEIGLTGAFNNILCFHEDGELVYQNPDYNRFYINTNTAVTTLDDQVKLIEVFPNDKGLLTIRILNQHQGELTLFNLEGKQLIQQKINAVETQIYIPATGIIMYQFTNNKGKKQTGKIVVAE